MFFSTATGYQPAPQAGYAVQPATYTTPRAAATAYDVASYQTAAATQSAYGMFLLYRYKFTIKCLSITNNKRNIIYTFICVNYMNICNIVMINRLTNLFYLPFFLTIT